MADPTDAPLDITVTDNEGASRYEAHIDDEVVGFTNYLRHDDRIVFTHAEVDPRWEGRGVGTVLARGALDDVIAQRKTITPLCPFIVEFVRRNPSYLSHVDEVHRRELKAAQGD